MRTKHRLILPVILLCAVIVLSVVGGLVWYDRNVDRSGWVEKDGIRFYQDEMPERVPLTDNPEFRTMKNMILQEAENLAFAD